MTKKYKIENLSCSHCAATMESRIAKLDNIQNVNLNFANALLTFETHQADINWDEQINASIRKIERECYAVPMEPQAKAKENTHPHTQDGNGPKALWILGSSIILFVLGLLPIVPTIMQVICLVASAAIAGYETLWSGLKNIKTLHLDENILMSIAAVAAIILGEYMEAAAVCIFFRLGSWLEGLAVQRSRRSITALADIRPDRANLLLENGRATTIPAQEVSIGQQLEVRPFERVPLDGIILDGESTLDASALTGESLPIDAHTGIAVYSGMVNGSGRLRLEVTQNYANSAASRIIEMVEEAAARKSQSERLITKFSRYYTPIVVLAAIFLAVLPPLFALGPFSMWMGRALVFLVASCPCALVLSVPLGFFAGIGAASKQGILVKGGRFLEALSRARTLVTDKTGTLTQGEFVVRETIALPPYTKESILHYAALAESASSHPIAKAVVKAYQGELISPAQYTETPGQGIRMEWEGRIYLVGSARLMQNSHITLPEMPPVSLYVACDDTVIGGIHLTDSVREGVPETLRALAAQKVNRVVMLTGDNLQNAEDVADICGIQEVHAGLLPDQKVEHMQALQTGQGTTLYIGDGINDAPVLAMADVGIAMGLGNDAAIQSADVVLVNNDMHKLPNALHIAKRTIQTVRFNIAFALIVKAVVLLAGALGIWGMWAAVVADVGVSILCVLNSSRLLKKYK